MAYPQRTVAQWERVANPDEYSRERFPIVYVALLNECGHRINFGGGKEPPKGVTVGCYLCAPIVEVAA